MQETQRQQSDHDLARIVIADGDRRVRQALRALFETNARLIITGEATTADQLLAIVRATAPLVVILDLLLPTAGEGIQTIRQLVVAQCPVIVVLTAAMSWREAAMDAGADEFLDKGLDTDLVLSTVSDAALRAQIARLPLDHDFPKH